MYASANRACLFRDEVSLAKLHDKLVDDYNGGATSQRDTRKLKFEMKISIKIRVQGAYTKTDFLPLKKKEEHETMVYYLRIGFR